MYQCHIRYPTHAVDITVDDDRVVCFKYNKRHCDIERFDRDEVDQVSDYIMTPLPRVIWSVKIDGDPEEDSY